MKKSKIEKFLSTLHGSIASNPFGPDALVFKVMDKMFALVSQNPETPVVTFKCAPADGVVLTSQFDSIVPGYHMNKKHWITVTLNGDVADAMLIDLANNSYNLIVNKLTKADKTHLDNKVKS